MDKIILEKGTEIRNDFNSQLKNNKKIALNSNINNINLNSNNNTNSSNSNKNNLDSTESDNTDILQSEIKNTFITGFLRVITHLASTTGIIILLFIII